MVSLDSDSDVLERGDAAPTFELPGADGATYALDDFADYDALLVVFTCNHCPYAKAKIPELNRLAEAYDDLAVVGVNPNDAEAYPDDSFERMQSLVESGDVAYDAYLRDERQSVAAAYGARCTPDPFLFRNDGGTFRLAYHGRLDDAPNPDDEPSDREMAAHVETLLAGDEITSAEKPSRGCSIKWTEGNEPDYWDV
ncbi:MULTISPECIES: thioredoxin family protein [Haloarcula]|uniref:Thioredoxin family protein n=1 Tax=Haloarcula pellucida TaxID=1427151 RepID=A0A830GM55_9EURY|nr:MULTISPECIES: thioredoxin family protein [Halomicroarcula]MBX0348053.1 thioredoxin family protein [Halomicroarcula pellucida]MDS0277898.1 thioredoxin family protein [Halomicroarcula sp. S1AR25-4]GGN96678.1 thioredoxin family protein [Halomicroarcula pellucida]